jgi:hypothetical protein
MITLNAVTRLVSPSVNDSEITNFNSKHNETFKCREITVRQIKCCQLWNIFHDDIQHCHHHMGLNNAAAQFRPFNNSEYNSTAHLLLEAAHHFTKYVHPTLAHPFCTKWVK